MALARAFHHRIESLPDKWMIYRQTLNYKTLQQYTDSIGMEDKAGNPIRERKRLTCASIFVMGLRGLSGGGEGANTFTAKGDAVSAVVF